MTMARKSLSYNQPEAIQMLQKGDKISDWIGVAIQRWSPEAKKGIERSSDDQIDAVFWFDCLSRAMSVLLARPEMHSGLTPKPTLATNLPEIELANPDGVTLDAFVANLYRVAIANSVKDGEPFDLDLAIRMTKSAFADTAAFGDGNSSFETIVSVSKGIYPKDPYDGLAEPWG